MRRISDRGAGLLVLAGGSVLALAIMAFPRPVVPTHTPGLHLSAEAVAQVRREDQRRASLAPTEERAERVRELYAEYSRAEVRGGETRAASLARVRALDEATLEVARQDGEEALWALRAEATATLMAAMEGGIDQVEREALLGTFPDVLSRYGAVRDGELVAPPFVARTLFVARWNAAHGLAPTQGMGEAELRAYWGWLALEADQAPVGHRLVALEGYAQAGGTSVLEARAVLLFEAGQMLAASEAFELAYEEEGTLRLRNHALAALELATAED